MEKISVVEFKRIMNGKNGGFLGAHNVEKLNELATAVERALDKGFIKDDDFKNDRFEIKSNRMLRWLGDNDYSTLYFEKGCSAYKKEIGDYILMVLIDFKAVAYLIKK